MESTLAAPAPQGYHVDLHHPQTNGLVAGVGVGIAGIVVSTTFIALRVYTKAVLAKLFRIDDACIVLAWAMAMTDHILFIWLRMTKRIGVHLWETTISKANQTIMIINIASILYVVLMALAKISLLLSYKRLSNLRWLKIAIWTAFGIIVGYSLGMTLALIFACTPFMMNWDITITDGTCINKGALYLAAAGATAATDLVLLVLPIPMVINLHLPRVQKAATICMFAIGSLTLVTSCIRLAVLPAMISSKDITWAVSTPALWTDLDASLATICGSFPTIRLFLRHVAPSWLGELSFVKSRRTDGNGTVESWTQLQDGSDDRSIQRNSLVQEGSFNKTAPLESIEYGLDEPDNLIVQGCGSKGIPIQLYPLPKSNDGCRADDV